MAQRTCDQPDCERPHFGRGLCNMHYYRLVRNPKKPARLKTCAWCGQVKTVQEMRHPSSSRGPTPDACHQCRDDNPTMAWCSYHNEAHPRDRFTPNPRRPIGLDNYCILAISEKASAKRELPDITCASCEVAKASWQFRGGGRKSATCRECESENSGRAWCVDCAEWLPRDRFTPNGKHWVFKYCKPCRTARAHGVSVAFILERQGAAYPHCAACGSEDFLKVDHDHRCCSSSSGCPKCVRGFLCHACNTCEGLLVTSRRVKQLMDYMLKHEADRSGRMGASSRLP